MKPLKTYNEILKEARKGRKKAQENCRKVNGRTTADCPFCANIGKLKCDNIFKCITCGNEWEEKNAELPDTGKS